MTLSLRAKLSWALRGGCRRKIYWRHLPPEGRCPCNLRIAPRCSTLFEKSSRTGFTKLFCIQRLIQSFQICFIFAVCYVKMNIVLPVFIVRNRNFSVFGQKKKAVTRTAKNAGEHFILSQVSTETCKRLWKSKSKNIRIYNRAHGQRNCDKTYHT